jgi:hypothetical protein
VVIFLSNIDLENIYIRAELHYFFDDVRDFLKLIIAELYNTNSSLLQKLRLHHIDRAIFKFQKARSEKVIHHEKQYFKACLLSSITETALDKFEPLDFY